MIRYILIYGLVMVGCELMEERISTNCLSQYCETCWSSGNSNYNCTSCKSADDFVQVEAFADYVHVGGPCQSHYNSSEDSAMKLFFVDDQQNQITARIVITQASTCPSNPCGSGNFPECKEGICQVPCEDTTCNICSADGKNCYSCKGSSRKMLIENMIDYWANGGSCSLTCGNNYNSGGHIQFQDNRLLEAPTLSQDICLIDYPCESNGICYGKPENVSDCSGWCSPRFQCPVYSDCSMCYPYFSNCLTCKYGYISVDYVNDYVWGKGANCQDHCDTSKNAKFEIQYILYNLQIIPTMCVQHANCDDDPCNQIRQMSGVSSCNVWNCTDKSWSFPTWGIILSVIGGIVVLGAILVIILVCRRMAKKRAAGVDEYHTLFGDTDPAPTTNIPDNS